MENSRKRQIILIAALIFISAVLVYANTIKGDFIWDDEYLILNNSQIKNISNVPNVFTTYLGYGSDNRNNFYRPLQELSNMADYRIWGQNPAGYHLTNILLHAIVAVMVFIFLIALMGGILPAGIAAMLYAIHPIHTEAVAYIAGRSDPLSAIFMLGSLVAFIGFVKEKAKTAKEGELLFMFSLALFVLALLSKEISVIMPVLVFLYLFLIVKDADEEVYRKVRHRWIPYAAITAVYAALRVTILNFSAGAPDSAIGGIALPLRLLTFFKTIWVYLGLIIFPTGLHMERTTSPVMSALDPTAFYALIIIAGVFWAVKISYKRNKLVTFAILWFFANLIPVTNIVPINSFVAEHWVYMASIGPFLLIGMGISFLLRQNEGKKSLYGWGIVGLISAYCGFLAITTVVRNADWRDEISFFKSTLKYKPTNAKVHLNLGNTYFEKEEYGEALEEYKSTIKIDKNFAEAYGNMASIYLKNGDPRRAEKYLKRAVALKDDYPVAHYSLGIVYYRNGKFEKAEEELIKVTRQLPQFYHAWNLLGRTYVKLDETEKAKEAYQMSLKIFPLQPAVKEQLSEIK